MQVIPVISKLNFLRRYSSESHDPSEIILIFWFADQKTFIIMLKTECYIFIINIMLHTFSGFFDE